MLDHLDGEKWRGYGEFFRGSPYAAFPQEHRSSPGRLPFHMITVDEADHDLVDPSIPEMLVALPLRASDDNVWAWNTGDGWHRESAVPGQLLLLPPNRMSEWEVRGSRTLLLLAIPTSTIRRILGPAAPEGISEVLSPLSQSCWKDDFVELLMMRLWQSSRGNHAMNRLLVDGALVALVSHLMQHVKLPADEQKVAALLPWRMKKVSEFIEAHLHEDVDIVQLASIAGLSVRHFARAFREGTGETPHRWLMAKRIHRASDLLRENALPISEIAIRCGFSNQSHFTKVFKQLSGATPKRWVSQHPS